MLNLTVLATTVPTGLPVPIFINQAILPLHSTAPMATIPTAILQVLFEKEQPAQLSIILRTITTETKSIT